MITRYWHWRFLWDCTILPLNFKLSRVSFSWGRPLYEPTGYVILLYCVVSYTSVSALNVMPRCHGATVGSVGWINDQVMLMQCFSWLTLSVAAAVRWTTRHCRSTMRTVWTRGQLLIHSDSEAVQLVGPAVDAAVWSCPVACVMSDKLFAWQLRHVCKHFVDTV